MKYELNLKIEGDEIIKGIRINFLGEDDVEIVPETKTTKKSSSKKQSPKGDIIDEPKVASSSSVITNSTSEVPEEMRQVF